MVVLNPAVKFQEVINLCQMEGLIWIHDRKASRLFQDRRFYCADSSAPLVSSSHFSMAHNQNQNQNEARRISYTPQKNIANQTQPFMHTIGENKMQVQSQYQQPMIQRSYTPQHRISSPILNLRESTLSFVPQPQVGDFGSRVSNIKPSQFGAENSLQMTSPITNKEHYKGVMPDPAHLNTAYGRASPLYLEDFEKEKGFANVPSVLVEPSFMEKLVKKEYLTSYRTHQEFDAYMNDCRTQFKHALEVINHATENPVYRKELLFPNIEENRQSLILDLDETLIHSEVQKDSETYDLVLVFPSLTIPGELDVLFLELIL